MPEINLFEASRRNIAYLLGKHGIEYMVIGGLANAKWGNPRATLDIDITIWMPDPDLSNLLSQLGE